MREGDQGLEINGTIDLDDELGARVWKSLKRNRIGFSFGFITLQSRELSGGGKELIELDLFEVSATPSPANNRTRLLDWKSVERRYSDGNGHILTYDEMMEDIEARTPQKKAQRPITIASFEC